jgi:hypothetical protein
VLDTSLGRLSEDHVKMKEGAGAMQPQGEGQQGLLGRGMEGLQPQSPKEPALLSPHFWTVSLHN